MAFKETERHSENNHTIAFSSNVSHIFLSIELIAP